MVNFVGFEEGGAVAAMVPIREFVDDGFLLTVTVGGKVKRTALQNKFMPLLADLYEGPLDKVVVHGHTIFDRVMDCGNRIGIDTGAFRSGVLTALVLETDQRRVIQASRTDGGPVEVFHGERTR